MELLVVISEIVNSWNSLQCEFIVLGGHPHILDSPVHPSSCVAGKIDHQLCLFRLHIMSTSFSLVSVSLVLAEHKLGVDSFLKSVLGQN